MGIASEVSVFRDGRKGWAADGGGSSALFSTPDAQPLGPLCGVATASMITSCEAVLDLSLTESGVAGNLC